MRDIKFRAWDTAYNKMVGSHLIPGFKLGISFTGEVIGFDADDDKDEIESTAIYPNRFIVMQYTGLDDMNGGEIYESDIVEYRGKRGVVFMRLGCWFVELQRELGYYNHSVTIVGNIYEPESHT